LVRRLDRIGADAQRTGEHVGRAAGDHPDRGGGSAGAGFTQNPVDDLVDRAVAAVHDQHIHPLARRVAGDLDRVAPMVGVRDRQLHATLQRMGE
jgi:hypothetical protein